MRVCAMPKCAVRGCKISPSPDPTDALDALLADVRACTLCAAHLPLGPRPVLQVHGSAKILIAGQAPGRKVHESGVPFDDASGERLRAWLGVSRSTFYDSRQINILPMGFCYPGTGTSGDLPPRPECATAWRTQLLAHLKSIQLTLVLGQYALDFHLPVVHLPVFRVPVAAGPAAQSVTAKVLDWRKHWPQFIALPHPSPRNNPWLKRNPWFEAELLPELKIRVAQVLAA